jgi:hypothetical protein
VRPFLGSFRWKTCSCLITTTSTELQSNGPTDESLVVVWPFEGARELKFRLLQLTSSHCLILGSWFGCRVSAGVGRDWSCLFEEDLVD